MTIKCPVKEVCCFAVDDCHPHVYDDHIKSCQVNACCILCHKLEDCRKFNDVIGFKLLMLKNKLLKYI